MGKVIKRCAFDTADGFKIFEISVGSSFLYSYVVPLGDHKFTSAENCETAYLKYLATTATKCHVSHTGSDVPLHEGSEMELWYVSEVGVYLVLPQNASLDEITAALHEQRDAVLLK